MQLKQVQKLKKTLVRTRFGCKTLGQLRSTLAKSTAIPKNTSKGYFCHAYVSPPGQNKAKLSVMATTRILQQRWIRSPKSVVAADGGFKFNLLGWPLHVLGTVNRAGNFSLHGLGLTSTMASEHIEELFEGFSHSTRRVTGCSQAAMQIPLAMSDAEKAYRTALAKKFGADNLMCFFHV